MVCTKTWHVHFLSRRTLGLGPFSAAPWCQHVILAEFLSQKIYSLVTLLSLACFRITQTHQIQKWPESIEWFIIENFVIALSLKVTNYIKFIDEKFPSLHPSDLVDKYCPCTLGKTPVERHSWNKIPYVHRATLPCKLWHQNKACMRLHLQCAFSGVLASYAWKNE